jgi:hypothetical protein
MKPGCSLPSSQKLDSGPCPESINFTPSRLISLGPISLLLSHPRLLFQVVSSFQVLQPTFCVHFVPALFILRSLAHLILDTITVIIFGTHPYLRHIFETFFSGAVFYLILATCILGYNSVHCGICSSIELCNITDVYLLCCNGRRTQWGRPVINSNAFGKYVYCMQHASHAHYSLVTHVAWELGCCDLSYRPSLYRSLCSVSLFMPFVVYEKPWRNYNIARHWHQ